MCIWLFCTVDLPYFLLIFLVRGKTVHIHEYLNDCLNTFKKKENLSSISYLTKDYHIYPDFYGNRSPLADPTLKGMVSIMYLFYNHNQSNYVI